VTYSCCAEADTARTYRPGETLTAHWIVKVTEQPPAGPATAGPVELTAGLSGPYASGTTLKQDQSGSDRAAGAVAYTAAPVHPSGRRDEQPVSTVRIAPDARPGYYNLATTVSQDGGSVAGASIIQIVAGAPTDNRTGAR
jgi:hypothetical protein